MSDTKRERREPTQRDLDDPMFQAIWSVIKRWDANTGRGYHLCRGEDAVAILDSIRASSGHWQREVPKETGYYWTATRDGKSSGLQLVVYDGEKLVFAGMPVGPGRTEGWRGWWWSRRVHEPTPPGEGEW